MSTSSLLAILGVTIAAIVTIAWCRADLDCNLHGGTLARGPFGGWICVEPVPR